MITKVKGFIVNVEAASGDVPADMWAAAIIKLACVFVMGIVILQGVFVASNITPNSAMYVAYNAVVDNV